ncbi:TrbI/VirB10 family protein [Altericroceibacterium endophyticum]|uniref:Type VI secretion protein n=1 Tax=Altericroceibacterium endophyticum TaxID=1808508 RepID=A0A6I4TAB5_9SPHN|nr:TrbI/VirB10 family protein [Altericroceibacterium endophyticum]MXO66810.1 type VI secretion protein [Altericroceibacterium endophyticum]
MRLATRLPEGKGQTAHNDQDPRDNAPAEVIDLASRTAYPTVTQRKGPSDALGLAAGVGFVALLGAATLWGLNASRMDESAQNPASSTAVPTPAPAVTEPVQQPAEKQQENPAPKPAAPAPVTAQAPQAAPQAAANPYATPTVVFDASNMPAPAAPAGPAGEPTGNSANDFASRIGGVGGAPAQARVDVDPGTTVTQGTMIPAILETAIDTDVPGYVRAVVSQDVRSFDGTRVLVPRSSRLIGQYQSGLQNGQKRAYVIWTRLIRPDGVSVQIASPATGFDGRAGLHGDVDNHFFKRFGSAMLLSVIGGLTTVASGGTSVILGGGESAAAAAISQNGQISPTVRVRQGEPIRVFTARDLDFSRAPQL